MVQKEQYKWQDELSSFFTKARELLIVILGPTASGKTGFSIELSKHIGNAEVVNADSRQLYKYLDIGTAKITLEEMSGIPHHLIDVLDPKEEAAAGWYQTEAQNVISQIRKRGNVPLLVGGSMLYVSTIIDKLTLAPTSNKKLRERLMQEYDKDEGESLHARLCEIDPEAASRFHKNNKPRLVRAVEIFELTQKPKSDAVPQDELCPRGLSAVSGVEPLIFGVGCLREEIVERINARTEQMFKDGWIEEVQGLLDRGYKAEDPGMKSTGYREIVRFLQEGEPALLDDLKEGIAAKTRQYARRQMTWWKRDSRIKWI